MKEPIQIPVGCQWTSITTYVNIDTGEQLLKKTATNKYKYIIVRTKKHTIFNKNKTYGTVHYIRECRKQPQLELGID